MPDVVIYGETGFTAALTQGSWDAMNLANCGRESFLRNSARPSAVAPSTCMTCIATSTAMILPSPVDAFFPPVTTL